MTKEQDYLKMAIDSMVDDEVEGPRVILGPLSLERLIKLVRNAALEEAWQAAQPEDSYQDEWFKAKADACRRINLLKEQG